MKVTPFDQASPYSAPKHNGCSSFRVQGLDMSDTEDFWIGISHFLPGGGAELDASPFEKAYVVIAGEITVEAKGISATLQVNDSCYIPANEERVVCNHSHLPASMVVVISKHARTQ